ncbi:MAG: PD40 domain-containing protein [Acidobacteria bacterium]|nr:PD40 domain-containing protein [Acidobacteriota bacterium]
MSPEQLEGLEADARSDIFAFGAVLYEMLTGRKAFEGRSQSSVIAAIMHVDPPGVSVVQPMTPPAMERIVRICLAKDPDERWQTAHDLALQFEWVAEGGSLAGVAAPVAARRRSRERLAWALLAASVLFIAALAVPAVRYFQGPPSGGLSRFLIETPVMPNPYQVSVSPDGRFALINSNNKAILALPLTGGRKPITLLQLQGEAVVDEAHFSPDGRWVAYASTESGTAQVYVASFPDFKTIRQASAAGGNEPRWRRDGKELFFLTSDGHLMAVDVKVSGSILETTAPMMLFETRVATATPGSDKYAVSADGRRFLFLRR